MKGCNVITNYVMKEIFIWNVEDVIPYVKSNFGIFFTAFSTVAIILSPSAEIMNFLSLYTHKSQIAYWTVLCQSCTILFFGKKKSVILLRTKPGIFQGTSATIKMLQINILLAMKIISHLVVSQEAKLSFIDIGEHRNRKTKKEI